MDIDSKDKNDYMSYFFAKKYGDIDIDSNDKNDYISSFAKKYRDIESVKELSIGLKKIDDYILSIEKKIKKIDKAKNFCESKIKEISKIKNDGLNSFRRQIQSKYNEIEIISDIKNYRRYFSYMKFQEEQIGRAVFELSFLEEIKKYLIRYKTKKVRVINTLKKLRKNTFKRISFLKRPKEKVEKTKVSVLSTKFISDYDISRGER